MQDCLFTHRVLHRWWPPSHTWFVCGEETDRFGANPDLAPLVSALLGSLVTAERSPHQSGIGQKFYHSFPFNAVKQQMSALLMRRALPPRTCIGLPGQEGNIRGQINQEEVVCCTDDCPLRPKNSAVGPEDQFLYCWSGPCIHWLTPALFQLNRNSEGLMAFSLTDLVKMTLLFLEMGEQVCAVIGCGVMRLPVLLSNERLSSNVFYRFVIRKQTMWTITGNCHLFCRENDYRQTSWPRCILWRRENLFLHWKQRSSRLHQD